MTASISKKKKRGKSFAKAFKLDIGREKEILDEHWEVQAGKSILMNGTRQKIYRYLCEYPCSTLSNIAHDIKLSAPSTTWHLKLLVERRLISRGKVGKQHVFYPEEMIDSNVIPLLTLLANSKINGIFNEILESPGIKQKELTESLGISHQSVNTFANRLEKEGLITSIRDGKFISQIARMAIEL